MNDIFDREKDKKNLNGDDNLKNKKIIDSLSHNAEKLLNIKPFKLEIKDQIPAEINVSTNRALKFLLAQFNRAHGSKYNYNSILSSKSKFRRLIGFIMYCQIKGYIVVADDQALNFINALGNIQEQFNQNLRSIEKYYDEIVEKIYYPQGLTKKDKKVQHEMYLFDQAYSLMKLAFKDEKRENNEKYFEHLKGTMEILLRELPNPNLNKILIGLLHDVQEDIPEYADVIERIYGEYISTGVTILSKKDWKEYLTDDEFFEYNNAKELHVKSNLEKEGKNRRNKDYFGHLDNLNDDYLDVKFADRIHNLRDSNYLTEEKLQRKIEETIKYFLHVAGKRNLTAYKLIIQEIEKLKLRLI
ncbi:MAG: hypothetical protein WC872_01405 [Candidatus Absconditabacterales bacterium]